MVVTAADLVAGNRSPPFQGSNGTVPDGTIRV